MSAQPPHNRFKLRVVGRFPAHHLSEGQRSDALGLDAISVAVLAGPDWEHVSFCGTLTMTESEWSSFVAGLERGLGGDVHVEDVSGHAQSN